MKYLFVCLKAAEPLTLIRGYCLWRFGRGLLVLDGATSGRGRTLAFTLARGLTRDLCAVGGRRFLCSRRGFRLRVRLRHRVRQYPIQGSLTLLRDRGDLCLLHRHRSVSDASEQVRRQSHRAGCEIFLLPLSLPFRLTSPGLLQAARQRIQRIALYRLERQEIHAEIQRPTDQVVRQIAIGAVVTDCGIPGEQETNKKRVNITGDKINCGTLYRTSLERYERTLLLKTS